MKKDTKITLIFQCFRRVCTGKVSSEISDVYVLRPVCALKTVFQGAMGDDKPPSKLPLVVAYILIKLHEMPTRQDVHERREDDIIWAVLKFSGRPYLSRT